MTAQEKREVGYKSDVLEWIEDRRLKYGEILLCRQCSGTCKVPGAIGLLRFECLDFQRLSK